MKHIRVHSTSAFQLTCCVLCAVYVKEEHDIHVKISTNFINNFEAQNDHHDSDIKPDVHMCVYINICYIYMEICKYSCIHKPIIHLREKNVKKKEFPRSFKYSSVFICILLHICLQFMNRIFIFLTGYPSNYGFCYIYTYKCIVLCV